MKAYDVHLYAVVRFDFPNITAESHEAATQIALNQWDDGLLHQYWDFGDGQYSDEIKEALVDVVGDENYEETKWVQTVEGV